MPLNDERRRLKTYDVVRNAPAVWSTNTPPAYPAPPADAKITQLEKLEILTYDKVGNPKLILDHASEAGYLSYGRPMSKRLVEYTDLYQVKKVSYGYGDAQGPGNFRSPYLPEIDAGDTRPMPLQTQPANRVAQQDFAYDYLGNVVTSTDDASVTYDRSLGAVTHGSATDGPNQLRGANGVSASYDDAGNMIELTVQRQGDCTSGASSKCAQWFAYDWDEVGQLVRARRWDYATTLPVVTPGDVPADLPAWDLSYAYSEGMRVRKSAKDATGAPALHAVDIFATLRLEEASFNTTTETYLSDRSTQKVYFAGGAARIFERAGSWLPAAPTPQQLAPLHMYITFGDHLGSSVATIEHASSELVERVSHQAFGAIESDYRPDRWSHAREPFKFTGKCPSAGAQADCA
jgi:hypothetical protein